MYPADTEEPPAAILEKQPEPEASELWQSGPFTLTRKQANKRVVRLLQL